MDFSKFSIAELDQARDEVLDPMTPKLKSYTLLRATGLGPAAAARLAGYSMPASLDGLEKRTREAQAILVERTNRTVEISIGWLREKFIALHNDALQAADRSTARACLTEIGKLAALYPEQRLRLQVETAQAPLAEVTEEEWALAARLTHEVRQQLPAATVDVTPAAHEEEETDAA
ncbi:MAG: hypothetical protein RJA59_1271 [Pseudomonadota bacterium]|jgi:hypothetical protein